MTKNKRTKSKGSNGFFQEFIDQLITAIFGELLIYIIALLFMSALGGIIFAAICFSWGRSIFTTTFRGFDLYPC